MKNIATKNPNETNNAQSYKNVPVHELILLTTIKHQFVYDLVYIHSHKHKTSCNLLLTNHKFYEKVVRQIEENILLTS